MALKDELLYVLKAIGKQTYKNTKEACGIIKDICKEQGLTKEDLSKTENFQELRRTLKEIKK